MTLDLYEPRAWGWVVRRVTDEDGKAWAEALDRALQNFDVLATDPPPKAPIIINGYQHMELNRLMNMGLTPYIIQGFCAYLRRGDFEFAWDD